MERVTNLMENVVHERETRERTQLLTPDKKARRTVEGTDQSAAVEQGLGPRDRGAKGDTRRNGIEPSAITGVQAQQFRKGERPAPETGPDKPPRSSSMTSLAIFLALLGLMALIILALIM